MGSKPFDFTEITSGNWNIAKSYTIEKILKWIVLIGDFRTIAEFGSNGLEGDLFMNDKNLRNQARILALKRLIHSTSSLIRNTKFAIKPRKEGKRKLNDKEIFSLYEERLKKIKSKVDYLRVEQKRGNRLVELDLNEKFFTLILNELDDIMDDINYILNKNDLIFTHMEEVDPRKIKEALKEKYVNRS